MGRMSVTPKAIESPRAMYVLTLRPFWADAGCRGASPPRTRAATNHRRVSVRSIGELPKGQGEERRRHVAPPRRRRRVVASQCGGGPASVRGDRDLEVSEFPV